MNITKNQLLQQVERAARDWPFIEGVGAKHGLLDYLLYAVGSRETNLRNIVGDFGHGHGVFQLDDRSHAIPDGFDQNVEWQAEVAAEMLAGLYKRYGGWLEACNAYNSGRPTTSSTTGHDYGPDVLERRATIFAELGPPSVYTEDGDD